MNCTITSLALLCMLFCSLPAIATEIGQLESQVSRYQADYDTKLSDYSKARRKATVTQGEILAKTADLEMCKTQMDSMKTKLERKQKLMQEDPDISVEKEREAFKQAKRAFDDCNSALYGLRFDLVKAQRDENNALAAVNGVIPGLANAQRQLGEARFQKLKIDLEREQIVEVEAESSCGDYSVAKCKDVTMSEAKRKASEQGSAVLVEGLTEVRDFQLSKDEIRTRVKALVLSTEILGQSMIGEGSGYRYRIRARIKGQVPSELRDTLIGHVPPVIGPLASIVPVVNKTEPDKSLVFLNRSLQQNDSWKAEILIQCLEHDKKCGSIAFRSLKCGGDLIYRGNNDDGYLFDEKLSYGNCVPGCQILLDSTGSTYKEICNGRVSGSGKLLK